MSDVKLAGMVENGFFRALHVAPCIFGYFRKPGTEKLNKFLLTSQ